MTANDEPLVSVLLPAYNVEEYLAKCVDSILQQTYQNFEIIIADDCSPDDSGKIADKLASKDARIKVFHHGKNMGLSAARNTGLNHASGDYITFVDSDDWIEPDYVEYLLRIIQGTDSDIAISRNFFTSRFREQVTEDRITTITPEDMLCDLLYNRIHVGVWNRMYKKSLIGNSRFRLDSLTGEGMQFNTRVVPKASKVGMGLRRVYTYNVDNETSATKKPNVRKQAYGAVATMDMIREGLKPRSKRLDDAVEYQYFTTALYALTHLIRAKAVSENRDFYKKLVRYTRSTALKTLSMETSTTQKIKSLLVAVSPTLTVSLAIFWRYGLGRKQRV